MTEGHLLPRPVWARDLAGLDDEGLRAALAGLPAARQAELVLAAGWQDRLRLVMNSDCAAEVVKALPREDLFLTIKSLEEDDALALVALTTPTQLRFILDMDLWKKDELDGEKVVAWLRRLVAAGETKVVEFVTTADLDLLAIFSRKLVYLVPNEEGIVLPAGLPGIMADEFFTVMSNFPEDTETIGLFLRIVRQADRDLFYKMLFAAYGMADLETQEEALRWRNSRLEESGFLDFDEAVEIYGYISEVEARQVAGVSRGSSCAPEAAGPVAPAYPVLLVDRKGFFYDVMAELRDRALATRLRQELAFSANRLLVADAESIGDLSSIKKAVERLFALVNVGLLFLSGGDREEAARVLANVSVRDIFQIGFSRLADLKSVAGDLARRYWPERATEGFGLLEPREAELITGLLLRVPQRAGAAGEATGFRDFATSDEVERARATLEEIGAAAEACFDRLGIPRAHEAKLAPGKVFALGLEDITLGNLLLTGFVNFSLRGEFDIAPLARADLVDLFDRVMEVEASRRRVRADGLAAFIGWLAGKTGFEGPRMDALRRFVLARAAGLEEELGGVAAADAVDPRYIRALLFRPASNLA